MWMALIATAQYCFWREHHAKPPGSGRAGNYNGISPGRPNLSGDWDTWLACVAVLVPLAGWVVCCLPFVPLLVVFFVVPLLALVGLLAWWERGASSMGGGGT